MDSYNPWNMLHSLNSIVTCYDIIPKSPQPSINGGLTKWMYLQLMEVDVWQQERYKATSNTNYLKKLECIKGSGSSLLDLKIRIKRQK